jgi:hypothetical protein
MSLTPVGVTLREINPPLVASLANWKKIKGLL